MTARRLALMIGRRGVCVLHTDSGVLRLPVVVTDARGAYGRVDVEVEPLLGSGRIWVRRTNLTLDDEEGVA